MSLWLLLLPTLAFAGADDAVLFPHRAALHVEGEGLHALELDGEVLGACRPDLSDLRIHDADGNEVPWLVDGGSWRTFRRLEPKVIDRSRSERWRDGDWRWRESLVVEAPKEGDTRPWRLRLDLDAHSRTFVRRIIVRQKGRVLAGPETIWSLGRQGTKLSVALKPFSSGPIDIEIAGEGSGWLNPVVVLESGSQGPARRLDMVLEPSHTIHGGGRTELVVPRPRGLVPEAIVVSTSTQIFDREVTVWDGGPGREKRALGAAAIHRLPGDPPVENLTIPLHLTPDGTEFRIMITDGDSPPLDEVEVHALLEGPTLVFEMTGRDGADGWLYYGGGRARAPDYDLQRLLSTGDADEVKERLRKRGMLGTAKRDATEPNPALEDAPRLDFAARAGAVVDPRAWSHQRGLSVGQSDEAVHRVHLGPADLGTLRPDRGDLRVIDGDARQWPYLTEELAHPVVASLHLREPTTADGETAWLLTLPGGEAPVQTLGLEIAEPFFDRAWRVETIAEPPAIVTSGRLLRRNDPRPVQLELQGVRAEALRLVVENGDDAPLTIQGARAWLPGWELWLAAPAGTYRILLGNPKAEPPSYELSAIRGVVLSTRAPGIEPARLTTNTGHVARLHRGEEGNEQMLVWAVLVLATLVLGGLTLANARPKDADPPEG
jgi:hypothetical protein